MKINTQLPLAKWGGIIILASLHFILLNIYGKNYENELSIFPVLVAGWFFGRRAGMVTAFILLAGYVLILYIKAEPWQSIFDANFILNLLILSLSGIGTGWLKSIYKTQNIQDVELKNRLREADALAKISIALSQAERVGLAGILQLIVDSAKNLIPSAEQAVIHILDEEKKYLVAQAASGFQDAPENRLRMQLGKGIAGQAILSGETINITDTNTDARFLRANNTPRFRSLLVTPIVGGEEKLGTISVQSELANAFTQHEQELLGALGVQAAIAIENARLLESTQQSLKETNALYRINQGLVAFTVDELLEDVVNLLKENFGYYHVQVYIVETQSKEFILKAASGEIGKELLEQKHRLQAGAGIVGYVAETLMPFFSNNVDEVVFFIRNPLLPDTKSVLTIPVKIDAHLFGILDIQQALPKNFSTRDLQVVSSVADQLAFALQKAELYQSLQDALQHEKSMRNQLIQSERLAAVGRLLASVSHELNNPLQAIQNALFLLKEEKGISEQGKQDLNIVLAESERMAGLIERLREAYRPIREEDYKETQINNLVNDTYALLATHLRHNQVEFEFIPDNQLPTIPVLTNQIKQAILNLVINAMEAMPTGGKITIQTQHLPESDEILISITDTGKGISANILPNIFEAFITDKETGTGLGLTITYDIVTKHHGHISAKNNYGAGATFSVWLPTKRLELV